MILRLARNGQTPTSRCAAGRRKRRQAASSGASSGIKRRIRRHQAAALGPWAFILLLGAFLDNPGAFRWLLAAFLGRVWGLKKGRCDQNLDIFIPKWVQKSPR